MRIEMNKIRVSFFVSCFDAGVNSILDSQLYPKLKQVSGLGCKCQFVGVTQELVSPDLIVDRLMGDGVDRVDIIPVYPKKSDFLSLQAMLLAHKRVFLERLKEWGPEYIYFRSLYDYVLIGKSLKKKGYKVVFDVRGALSNEFKNKHLNVAGVFGEFLLRRLESYVFRDADYLLCVSEKMKAWIGDMSGRKDVCVMPCSADTSKFYPDKEVKRVLKKKLEWPEESIVFAYVGSASYWQRTHDIVQMFVGLEKYNSLYRFLILTPDVNAFEKKMISNSMPESKYVLKKVPYLDVPKWLRLCDIGVVLRYNVLLNCVASPIKIAEYLSSGMAVICSDCVGDYSENIAKSNSGIVVGDDKDVSYISRLLDICDLSEMQKNALVLSQKYSLKHEVSLWVKFFGAGSD